MKTWRGMAKDFTALSDGAEFIRNISFDLEGEMSRRIALELTLTATRDGRSEYGMVMYGAPTGDQYVILADSSGNVESALAV